MAGMSESTPWTISDAIKVVVFTIFSPLYLLLIVPAYTIPGLRGVLHQLFANPVIVNAVAEGLFVATEALLLVWVLRKYHVSWRELGLRRFNWTKALVYIVGFYLLLGVAVAIAFTLVHLLAPVVNLDQAQSSGFDFGKAGIGLWISFVVTVIIAPITEEIYF